MLKILSIIATSIIYASTAHALTFNSPLGKVNSFETLINQIITSVLSAASVLAILSFLYGGWLWFFSRGDTKMIEKSRLVMFWSVAGLAAILISYGAVNLILLAVGIK